jgi:hypothetical protein
MSSAASVAISTAASSPTALPAPGVVFHAAAELDTEAIAAMQAQVRWRVLRNCVRRGLIGKCDAAEMAGREHGGGFSVDAAGMPGIWSITVPSHAPTVQAIWC